MKDPDFGIVRGNETQAIHLTGGLLGYRCPIPKTESLPKACILTTPCSGMSKQNIPPQVLSFKLLQVYIPHHHFGLRGGGGNAFASETLPVAAVAAGASHLFSEPRVAGPRRKRTAGRDPKPSQANRLAANPPLARAQSAQSVWNHPLNKERQLGPPALEVRIRVPTLFFLLLFPVWSILVGEPAQPRKGKSALLGDLDLDNDKGLPIAATGIWDLATVNEPNTIRTS